MSRKSLITLGFLFGLLSPVLGQSDGEQQVALLGGVFSPSDNEIQNIYGDALFAHGFFATPLNKQARIKIGANYFSRSGDPFYLTDDFDAGDAGSLRLIGTSLSLEVNPFSASYPRLYFGAGIDYVFAREEITGLPASTGSAIGAHLSVTPEFRLSNALSFVLEVNYRFLEMPFKNDDDRFRFNLSGAGLLAGLGFNLGR